MKKLLSIISLVVAISSQAQAQVNNGFKTYELDSMITKVNNSIKKASEKLGTDLTIQSAEITLKTVYDKSFGGGFKLFVKANHSWELEKASTLTFYYTELQKNEKKSEEKIKEAFEDNLTNAIVCVAEQWKNTSVPINGLKKDNYSVEISFIVTKNSTAGIEFEIWGVGLDSEGTYETSAVHTISLAFKN